MIINKPKLINNYWRTSASKGYNYDNDADSSAEWFYLYGDEYPTVSATPGSGGSAWQTCTLSQGSPVQIDVDSSGATLSFSYSVRHHPSKGGMYDATLTYKTAGKDPSDPTIVEGDLVSHSGTLQLYVICFNTIKTYLPPFERITGVRNFGSFPGQAHTGYCAAGDTYVNDSRSGHVSAPRDGEDPVFTGLQIVDRENARAPDPKYFWGSSVPYVSTVFHFWTSIGSKDTNTFYGIHKIGIAYQLIDMRVHKLQEEQIAAAMELKVSMDKNTCIFADVASSLNLRGDILWTYNEGSEMWSCEDEESTNDSRGSVTHVGGLWKGESSYISGNTGETIEMERDWPYTGNTLINYDGVQRGDCIFYGGGYLPYAKEQEITTPQRVFNIAGVTTIDPAHDHVVYEYYNGATKVYYLADGYKIQVGLELITYYYFSKLTGSIPSNPVDSGVQVPAHTCLGVSTGCKQYLADKDPEDKRGEEDYEPTVPPYIPQPNMFTTKYAANELLLLGHPYAGFLHPVAHLPVSFENSNIDFKTYGSGRASYSASVAKTGFYDWRTQTTTGHAQEASEDLSGVQGLSRVDNVLGNKLKGRYSSNDGIGILFTGTSEVDYNQPTVAKYPSVNYSARAVDMVTYAGNPWDGTGSNYDKGYVETGDMTYTKSPEGVNDTRVFVTTGHGGTHPTQCMVGFYNDWLVHQEASYPETTHSIYVESWNGNKEVDIHDTTNRTVDIGNVGGTLSTRPVPLKAELDIPTDAGSLRIEFSSSAGAGHGAVFRAIVGASVVIQGILDPVNGLFNGTATAKKSNLKETITTTTDIINRDATDITNFTWSTIEEYLPASVTYWWRDENYENGDGTWGAYTHSGTWTVIRTCKMTGKSIESIIKTGVEDMEELGAYSLPLQKLPDPGGPFPIIEFFSGVSFKVDYNGGGCVTATIS